MWNWVRLIVSVVICECAGIIGSVFTSPAIPTWYAALEKPAFTPPNWLFAPAWGILFFLMGVAAFLVWRAGSAKPQVRTALILFLVQLVLNIGWSVAFFGYQCPLCGMVVILILWVAIFVTMLKFFRISAAAGALMVPYILWVSFATALNVAVYLLNR